MEEQEMKQDIDNFIRELFYGFSRLAPAANVEKFSRQYGNIIRLGNVEGLHNEVIGIVENYISGKEINIRQIYSRVVALRMTAVIINNPESISSLQMEKLVVENENRKLLGDNEILSAELKAYKEFVALQGKSLKTGIG